jgi:hypothetical protein
MYYMTVMAARETYALRWELDVNCGDAIPEFAGAYPSVDVLAVLRAVEKVCDLSGLAVESGELPGTFWVLFDDKTIVKDGELHVVAIGNTAMARKLHDKYVAGAGMKELAAMLTHLLGGFKPRPDGTTEAQNE